MRLFIGGNWMDFSCLTRRPIAQQCYVKMGKNFPQIRAKREASFFRLERLFFLLLMMNWPSRGGFFLALLEPLLSLFGLFGQAAFFASLFAANETFSSEAEPPRRTSSKEQERSLLSAGGPKSCKIFVKILEKSAKIGQKCCTILAQIMPNWAS